MEPFQNQNWTKTPGRFPGARAETPGAIFGADAGPENPGARPRYRDRFRGRGPERRGQNPGAISRALCINPEAIVGAKSRPQKTWGSAYLCNLTLPQSHCMNWF